MRPQPGALALLLALLHQSAPPALLQFQWPEQLVATVESTQRRDRRTGESTQVSTASATYRLRALPHDDGTLVTFDRFEPGPATGAYAAMAERVTFMPAAVVVDQTGRFVRLADRDGFLASARKALADASGSIADPSLRQLFDQITSEPVLTGLASRDWLLMVGHWLDRPTTIAEPIEETGDVPFPLAPSIRTRLRTVTRASAPSPCRSGLATSCVTLTSTTRFDPDSLRDALTTMMASVPGAAGAKYEEFDQTTVLEVTLEPATMVPHRATMTRTLTVRVTVPGEPPSSMHQTDVRSMAFNYPPPRTPSTRVYRTP